MNEPDTEQKRAAVNSRLAELAAKFLERSTADVTALRTGLGQLASGDATALGEVRHLAHRMVGTGATLGFESLSQRAWHLEQLTESCPAGALPDEALRASLAAALEALNDELRGLRGHDR
jgi:HPt (histidine-containing phosphotransfer) domain-containing protein